MPWLASLLLVVPSIVAGWIVSTENLSFWVITFVIAMVMLALIAAVLLYIPWVRSWWRDR